MASELRKTILEVEDIQSEIVPVPEWKGIELNIVGMDGLERAKFMNRVAKDDGTNFEAWYPELIIATAFDPETGEKIFEPADRDRLNKKNGAALDRVSSVAMRLSGLGAGAAEAAREDLDGTPSAASSSS